MKAGEAIIALDTGLPASFASSALPLVPPLSSIAVVSEAGVVAARRAPSLLPVSDLKRTFTSSTWRAGSVT